ncbi:uncharacterized protein LOC113429758, partial [Notechis scutatus]|uniref:ribonuclease H n=1 Tax=Notechis scutatus TaxID=8663 RepID=A0A6J1W6N7_9SAUR
MARLDQLSPYVKSLSKPSRTDRSVQADRSHRAASTPVEDRPDPIPSAPSPSSLDQDLAGPGTSSMTKPVAARTRAKTEQPSLVAPLRQVDQLAINPKNPSESVTLSLFQHVPFTSSDLLNWKLHYGPFSEKPTEVADLVKTIMDAHNPSWLDIQQLMGILFSPEEREKIRNAVTEILKPDVQLYNSMEDLLRVKYPSSNPDWDLYSDGGKEWLRDYQSLLVRAICLAGKPVINMSKPSLVLQEPTESPEAFFTCLIDAYRMYTSIDPSAPENAQMLTMAFISQSALDIRRKLQRLEGALGKPMSELMEVARKVFANRDKEEDRKKDQKMQRKAELMAASMIGHTPAISLQAIQDIIDLYLEHHILVPTESPWNTPILPIPKGDGRFRPVQDLRPVNLATVTIHLVVPNPYVILGLIPQAAQWFSVIDLKDAFFTIPIHENSQHLFAFEWESPITSRKQQYTWTRLPQGFKNSPTLFGAALAKDLEALHIPAPDVVLQYVDDLLVTGRTEEGCWDNMRELLSLLQSLGYKASRKKAQLVLQKVRYLGYDIEQGKRTLGHERKEAICQLPRPTNRRDLRGFLGAAGFCCIWIPNFSLIAKPLYEATKGANNDPLQWDAEEEASFQSLKQALLQAPSLGLPDLEKPFQLFVDTKRNVAVGVLTQTIGTWHRPVEYLSKQLDNVAKRWPTCLKAVAGTAILTQEASKLTFGQQLDICTPHALKSVLEMKGHLWLTNPRMLKYQGLLTHNPMITLTQSTTLNPATLLPEPNTELIHDCIHTIEETYASRPDMKDVPLLAPDYTLFTDGTSYLQEGMRRTGYAVVTLNDVWEVGPLPPRTSAQLAELHALTRALELAKGLAVNIYTDSKYAFLTVQVHGALYKERGLITAGGKDIKYGPQILRLLESVWTPTKVAVMHCHGHQKVVTDIQKGNECADRFAREAALVDFAPVEKNLDIRVPDANPRPHYSRDDMARLEALEAHLDGHWWVLPDNRVYIHAHMAWDIVRQVAEIKSWIHWSRVKLAAPTLWKAESRPGSPLKVVLKRTNRDISPSGDKPEAVPLPTGDEEDLLSPSGDTPEAVPLPTGGEDHQTP